MRISTLLGLNLLILLEFSSSIFCMQVHRQNTDLEQPQGVNQNLSNDEIRAYIIR